MTAKLVFRLLLALPLFFASAPFATANDSDVESVIPPQSTDRFLNRVPPYATGKPSPNIVAPTRALGEYQNGPASKMERFAHQPAGTSPAGPKGLSGSRIAGSSVEKRPIAVTPITRAPVTPAPIPVNPVTSSWR